MLNTDRFEEFISQYPIYEYRLVDTAEIEVRERVRIICKQECERYGTTWACPPAVGSLEECGKRIHSYPNGILFSSVAEVSDVMNMAEMLATRDAHEELTTEVAGFLKGEGFETFTLSTESRDLASIVPTSRTESPVKPSRKMHPPESHGVVVNELVEHHSMEYNLKQILILWFSLVLFRQRA